MAAAVAKGTDVIAKRNQILESAKQEVDKVAALKWGTLTESEQNEAIGKLKDIAKGLEGIANPQKIPSNGVSNFNLAHAKIRVMKMELCNEKIDANKFAMIISLFNQCFDAKSPLVACSNALNASDARPPLAEKTLNKPKSPLTAPIAVKAAPAIINKSSDKIQVLEEINKLSEGMGLTYRKFKVNGKRLTSSSQAENITSVIFKNFSQLVFETESKDNDIVKLTIVGSTTVIKYINLQKPIKGHWYLLEDTLPQG
jgi:hypothetical protein